MWYYKDEAHTVDKGPYCLGCKETLERQERALLKKESFLVWGILGIGVLAWVILIFFIGA